MKAIYYKQSKGGKNMFIINNETYVNMSEFASEVGKCPTSISNYIRKGILTPVKVVGRNKYFTLEQVERFKKGEYLPMQVKGVD